MIGFQCDLVLVLIHANVLRLSLRTLAAAPAMPPQNNCFNHISDWEGLLCTSDGIWGGEGERSTIVDCVDAFVGF